MESEGKIVSALSENVDVAADLVECTELVLETLDDPESDPEPEGRTVFAFEDLEVIERFSRREEPEDDFRVL